MSAILNVARCSVTSTGASVASWVVTHIASAVLRVPGQSFLYRSVLEPLRRPLLAVLRFGFLWPYRSVSLPGLLRSVLFHSLPAFLSPFNPPVWLALPLLGAWMFSLILRHPLLA